jgi:hypothetical protein
MSASRTKGKGVPPAVAVVALLVGGAFAAKSIAGALGGGDGGGVLATDDDAVVEESGGDASAERVVWTDLLAAHGSFDASAPVRLAFAVARDANAPPAAPIGETAAWHGAWRGEAPPSLRLGVVMVAANARRAVLGGRVVGIGEEVGGVRITRIEPGLVAATWRDRTLTYDLTGDVPREFRAELARRTQKADAAANAGAAAPSASAPAPAKAPQEQDR